MSAYYNEIDPDAAAILRELIASNVIAPGDVDTRSIKEVQADDLRGYAQCHFFAGGGLWSVAARLAGWPDDEPLWTGSCPCQPFSVAGKGGGADDPRHLWPDFFRLISAARPPVVMGEQVAGKAGRDWFHGVRSDLAGGAYGARAVDIPACAVDAPHIRQRLYWIAVADTGCERRRSGPVDPEDRAVGADIHGLVNAKSVGRSEGWAESKLRGGRAAAAGPDASSVTLGDAERPRLEGQCRDGNRETGRADADRSVAPTNGGDVADSAGAGREQAPHDRVCREAQGQRAWDGEPERPYGVHSRNGSWWAGADWIQCHDQKARRTFSNISGLAYGLPGRLAYVSDESFGCAAQEVINYANATKNRPEEVLRAVREGVFQAAAGATEGARRQGRGGLGSAQGFPPSQVLLAVLCELDRRQNRSGGLLAISEIAGKAVRGVRSAGESALPPCGWRHFQQYNYQSTDSLRELSCILARHAEEIGASVGVSDAQGMGLLTQSFPGRVGLWRVAGNAISPILAAEVIAAYRDTLPHAA